MPEGVLDGTLLLESGMVWTVYLASLPKVN